jgi:hypothetical protein
VPEEERHVHRQPQLRPQRVVELEVVDAQPPVADQPVMPCAGSLAVEEDAARPAGAQQLAVAQVEQVAVLVRDRLAAQLAALERRLAVGGRALRESPQS